MRGGFATSWVAFATSWAASRIRLRPENLSIEVGQSSFQFSGSPRRGAVFNLVAFYILYWCTVNRGYGRLASTTPLLRIKPPIGKE